MTLRQRFLKRQATYLMAKKAKGFSQRKAGLQSIVRITIDMYDRDPCLENLKQATELLKFVREIKN
jgi:hypothetical protein